MSGMQRMRVTIATPIWRTFFMAISFHHRTDRTDRTNKTDRTILSVLFIHIDHCNAFPRERIQVSQRLAGFIEGDAPSDQFFERQFSGGDQVEDPRIYVRLHAMAAEYLQFMRDDFSHRERGTGLISDEQSDLRMTAAT